MDNGSGRCPWACDDKPSSYIHPYYGAMKSVKTLSCTWHYAIRRKFRRNLISCRIGQKIAITFKVKLIEAAKSRNFQRQSKLRQNDRNIVSEHVKNDRSSAYASCITFEAKDGIISPHKPENRKFIQISRSPNSTNTTCV